MSFVLQLLQTVVDTNAEALVMHVGERPYVVTATDQIDLSSRALTFETLNAAIQQLLPQQCHDALDELGATQYELPPFDDLLGERFTVVAARTGEDLWVEVRRRRVPDAHWVPPDVFQERPPAGGAPSKAAAAPPPSRPAPPAAPAPAAAAEPPPPESPWGSAAIEDDSLAIPAADQLWPEDRARRFFESEHAELHPRREEPRAPVVEPPAGPAPVEPGTVAAAAESLRPAPPPSNVVVPIARDPIRGEIKPSAPARIPSGLDRLLRIAAARGASTLYLAADIPPSVRVEGEIQILEGEAALGSSDVEALMLELMPERNREALRSQERIEWVCEVEEIGRVRCLSFRDHRGAGGIFRMMATRVVSAEQLGLSRETQALAMEPEGLILTVAPRAGGKSTLIAALVDLINRGRRDYVITIENEVQVVHDPRLSVISQREVRRGQEEQIAAVRAAIREDPDVLVVEELRSDVVIRLVLEAAGAGHLVIAGVPAHSATAALDHIIDEYPPEHRRHAQMLIAENLRGVIAQTLVRKIGGGRIAARELLLNTPAVSALIVEGKTSQLPLAIGAGRKVGMTPLNDILIGYVQSGVVDVREAFRRSADRVGFVALLKRHGLDTSFLERFA
jgi:twitching motility protein PilT